MRRWGERVSHSGILGNAEYFANDYRDTYVRITGDKRQAWLYLAERADGAGYQKDDLLHILADNGVVYGINHSALVTMCKKSVYHREILVAEGDEPVEGSDGYYEFTFDIQSGKAKPVIREDGSVDYQSMKAVNSVEAGALLATYHHAIPGKDGKDVFGNVKTVPLVRELQAADGRGVYRGIDDPDKYYAEKSGKVEFAAGKLSIVNVLEFSGDVDQLTGKLEFFGDIHITGNVEAGTLIRAGKSLTIDGVVESADLYAGGDIILKRGIQGNQKAHIAGRGSLYADFIEHSYVKMEGDILANYILSSYISTQGQVKLTGKKASIIGGNIYAMMGVSCNVLGNPKEIKTAVASGISQEMYDENERIQQTLKEVRDKIQQIREEVKAFGNKITPELQESYKAKLQDQMTKQKTVLEQQKRLFEKMELARTSRIQIHEDIHMGSEICIDTNVMKIDKHNYSMEYRNVAGMITGKVMVYN
ncbi:MAG: DUF342 domain-containing protein [Lachnospiraceae bacterium]|nr:DUF342 domain-containing protein [Lachnospiraceae bacterium]